MELLFQISYFVFGIFLIFYGIKTFKNSEKIYLERKNKNIKRLMKNGQMKKTLHFL
jgi:sulfite exporter TauE/SafE